MTGGTGPGGVTQQVTLASASGSLQNPNPVQQQVNMQYVGSSISVTSLTSNVQNKPSSSSQSYVMAGGPGGQSLIVSGATMIPATATLGPASLVATGPHHERANIYVPPAAQATLTKVVAEESYMMQRASLQGQGVVHDSADDGHAVSIHVSGGGMGLQHEGGSADSHQSGQSEQRLKVEDALNYLDQVKYKFGNQPQVYNDFLDIMKEFKSQSIDTPGVISRVSNLFRGHPELIVGFNTFLPPGYKIEVQVHDQGSQVSYRVDGVTNYIVSNLPSGNISSSVLPSHSIQQSGSSAPIIQHTGNSLPVRTISSHQSHSGVASGGYGASGLSGVISNGNLSPAAAPGSLAAVGPNYEPDPPSSFTHSFSSPFVQNAFPSLQSQPVQFNHAINYVNKIKNRFHGQPERYKQFLDILHTYQKEQKNFKDGVPVKLSEQEVYSQVAKIFENQDDLLAEFGQFLPESSHQPIIDIKPNIESINLNMKNPTKASQRDYLAPPVPPPATRQTHTQSAPKRSSNAPTHTVAKKAKMSSAYQGVSFTEASKWGSLQDFAFFDKVRMVLKNSTVYDNFRMKEEEWRESQKNFNRVWKDQVERFYLKSLDHQGITFKQADMRMLRSKTLVSEIETIYDERHEQDMGDPDCPPLSGPHLTFQYGDRAMLDEACNLLLHHVRRLSGIQNEDKRKIKQLLKHFVPDLFKHTRMELSDDEVEAGSDDHDDRAKSPAEYQQNGGRNGNKRAVAKRGNAKAKKDDGDDGKGDSRPDESRRTAYKRALQKQAESIRAPRRPGTPPPKETKSANTNTKQSGPNKTKIKKEPEEPETFRVIQVPNAGDDDESYTIFFGNTAFYVFLRLHQILVERLGRMFERATKMILEEEEARGLHSKSIPPSVALRMRQESIDAVNYFPMFIENVKNLLDGNIEPGIYEDSMREMFGIHAYITYTMDKVVTNAVRQLQTLVSDDSCVKLSDLFIHAQKNGGAGGLCDTAEDRAGAEITYQKQAEKIDPEENCYKIVIYHKSFRMTVELLEGANIEEKETATQTIKWTAYMDSYTTHTVTGTDNTLHTLVKPMYLNRNVRMGQHVFRGKSYPPELAKMFFGTVDEPEKGPSPLHVPDKVRMRQKSEAGSPKCILSQTLDPISTEEAEDIEKQLERNAKKLEQAQKEKELDGSPSTPAAADSSPSAPDGTPSQPKKYLATISPVTPEEANRLEKQLELNAKRREDAAKAQKSPYIIKEGLQCMFQPNCYKMIYVANTENYFYLRGSLKKAKETHKSVSNRMNEAFGKWLEASATEDHITRCEDWLLSAKNSETKIVSSNDISLPPYRPFNKYVVKK